MENDFFNSIDPKHGSPADANTIGMTDVASLAARTGGVLCSRGIAASWSIRRIAQGLGRAPSTVSREIRRNGGIQGYRANQADRRTWERASRPKPCRLALHRELRWRVAQKLALQWSPEQISGWLKQEFPTDQDMQISHEAIYRSLFIQTRGVLKKELAAHLRTARRMRRPKSHNTKSGQGHS